MRAKCLGNTIIVHEYEGIDSLKREYLPSMIIFEMFDFILKWAASPPLMSTNALIENWIFIVFFFYKYEGKIYREVNLERVSPGLDFRMQTAFKRNERFFLWPAANGLFSWSVRGLLEGVNVKKREIVKPFLPLRPALTHIWFTRNANIKVNVLSCGWSHVYAAVNTLSHIRETGKWSINWTLYVQGVKLYFTRKY